MNYKYFITMIYPNNYSISYVAFFCGTLPIDLKSLKNAIVRQYDSHYPCFRPTVVTIDSFLAFVHISILFLWISFQQIFRLNIYHYFQPNQLPREQFVPKLWFNFLSFGFCLYKARSLLSYRKKCQYCLFKLR